ncbi:hypothetical protein [Desulfoluna spongiiphila]|uniref:Uncharacterized protein n=1 Tax=Desulfoluna spongiiphila TaxID=419481 RepID=A0A1G5J7X4_9BACT|nr:hypothetical protein [Desulfoluna spongiiphila]SCY84314.1 hypothetical protein SAMN05216233_1267 [Desulfoluna spongiiphila]
MERGYLKAWRKVEDSVSWSRGLEYRGLMWSILNRARFKPVYFSGHHVPAGSFGIVVSEWALGEGITRPKLQRMLKALEEDEFIKTENVSNRFCLITVVNWDTYQTSPEESEQPVNNQRTTDEQLPIKESNNIYITPQFLEFAEKYQQKQWQIHGNAAPDLTEELFFKGAETVGRLVQDGFSFSYIESVLEWAQEHHFWGKGQLRSLSELRWRKGRAVTNRFQNVAVQYEAERKASTPQSVVTDAGAIYRSFS